jgi:hypothetical protein
MVISNFKQRMEVERIGSAKDYTTGRKGTILNVDPSSERCQVSWHHEKDGRTIDSPNSNGTKRTWVHIKFLRIIEPIIL